MNDEPQNNTRNMLDVLLSALVGADRVVVETRNALGEIDAHYLHAPEILSDLGQYIAERDQCATGWQPIETAPKDGSDILIWQPKEDEQFVVYWDDVEDGWRFSPRHVLADEPTHWMPLPAPPGG